MFNNNINKPAITVFLPLTSAKTSFCQWQKLVLPGRFFPRKKTGFYRSLAKTCQPCNMYITQFILLLMVLTYRTIFGNTLQCCYHHRISTATMVVGYHGSNTVTAVFYSVLGCHPVSLCISIRSTVIGLRD